MIAIVCKTVLFLRRLQVLSLITAGLGIERSTAITLTQITMLLLRLVNSENI